MSHNNNNNNNTRAQCVFGRKAQSEKVTFAALGASLEAELVVYGAESSKVLGVPDKERSWRYATHQRKRPVLQKKTCLAAGQLALARHRKNLNQEVLL